MGAILLNTFSHLVIFQVTLLQQNQHYLHDQGSRDLQGSLDLQESLVSLDVQEPQEPQAPQEDLAPPVHLDSQGPLDPREVRDLLALQVSHIRAGTYTQYAAM